MKPYGDLKAEGQSSYSTSTYRMGLYLLGGVVTLKNPRFCNCALANVFVEGLSKKCVFLRFQSKTGCDDSVEKSRPGTCPDYLADEVVIVVGQGTFRLAPQQTYRSRKSGMPFESSKIK